MRKLKEHLEVHNTVPKEDFTKSLQKVLATSLSQLQQHCKQQEKQELVFYFQLDMPRLYLLTIRDMITTLSRTYLAQHMTRSKRQLLLLGRIWNALTKIEDELNNETNRCKEHIITYARH